VGEISQEEQKVRSQKEAEHGGAIKLLKEAANRSSRFARLEVSTVVSL
jgi:hypothetical protein